MVLGARKWCPRVVDMKRSMDTSPHRTKSVILDTTTKDGCGKYDSRVAKAVIIELLVHGKRFTQKADVSLWRVDV